MDEISESNSKVKIVKSIAQYCSLSFLIALRFRGLRLPDPLTRGFVIGPY